MKTAALTTTLAITFLAGCAQSVPKSVPYPQRDYTPPQASEERTSRISGSISSLLGTKTRARIESVDLGRISIASEPEQPVVVLSPGKRLLFVVCETNFATAIDKSDIEFEAQAGHTYELTCGAANLWSHTGSDFKILDKTAGSKVVATAFGPGRAYPPRGRLF